MSSYLARFIWARNRSANGRGNDPMPQLVHEKVGCAHLEIIASIPITDASLTIDNLCVLHPAPKVEP